MKMGLGKVSRKCVRVSIPYSLTYGDKSIEELSEIPGTLESYERKFKKTYESPSSRFRKKKLKEIGNEIKTNNSTFWKKLKRGRIWN
jgi:hypothetical protein